MIGRIETAELTEVRYELEPVRRRESVERGSNFDSDEEPAIEVEQKPTAANEGRRYPLRERRPPRRFPDREYVLFRKGLRNIRKIPTTESGLPWFLPLGFSMLNSSVHVFTFFVSYLVCESVILHSSISRTLRVGLG